MQKRRRPRQLYPDPGGQRAHAHQGVRRGRPVRPDHAAESQDEAQGGPGEQDDL